MKHVYSKWFLSESWGWRRFLADTFVGVIYSPFNLLWVIWWTALGYTLAIRLNERWGLYTWIGIPASIALVYLLLWVLSLMRIILIFPLPPCKQGLCRGIDGYTWVMGHIYGRERRGTFHYWCKCGDEYVREGKRFFYVCPDGTRQIYMTLVGFRKWQFESQRNMGDLSGHRDKQTFRHSTKRANNSGLEHGGD